MERSRGGYCFFVFSICIDKPKLVDIRSVRFSIFLIVGAGRGDLWGVGLRWCGSRRGSRRIGGVGSGVRGGRGGGVRSLRIWIA